MSFTAVTGNIPARAGKRKVRRWFKNHLNNPPKKGVPTPSIFVGQELMHGVDDFQAVMPPYWRIMSVFGPQPFAFNSREWRFIDMDGELAYDEANVGKEGAGPKVLSKRYVQWVHLKHRRKPRAHLYVFNTHAPPSLQVPLQPDGDISRDELHETLMNAFAKKIECTPNPLLFMGDINATWGNPNLKPLREADVLLANRPGQATHNDRQIDLIMYRGGIGPHRWGLRRMDSGIFPKVLKGDHNAVWAQFKFVK